MDHYSDIIRYTILAIVVKNKQNKTKQNRTEHMKMKTKMKPHTAADTHFHLPNVAVADITCMDPSLSPPVVAEKVCKTVRLIGFLIQNGVSKSKVVQDVQDVMKRGKNIGKALNNAMVRHHEAITCRPRDSDTSFLSPLEYQFSCSSSPPRPSRVLSSSRRNYNNNNYKQSPAPPRMCGGGTGGSAGRRVKVTHGSSSPALRECREMKEFHVDQAAEEFIERFYRELRLQKWLDHYC